MLSKKQILYGWGKYPKLSCDVFRPEKSREPGNIINSSNSGVISRGAGLSYGDAALNPNCVIKSERLNRFLVFDTKTGVLKVQAGVTIAEILSVTAPKGFIPFVIPGTKNVTIGGCLASDVHGKNHFRDGGFAKHVREIKLTLANGKSVNCSKTENPDIFWATAGGMGMTGFIEEIEIELKTIKSTMMDLEHSYCADISDMAEKFRSEAKTSEYMVGWINGFSGKNLGEGIFTKAFHADSPENLKDFRIKESLFSVPRFFPSFLMNKLSVYFFNKIRMQNLLKKPRIKSDLQNFFFPLDRLRNWNRFYSSSGFLQYHCLIPESLKAPENLAHIMKLIEKSGCTIFLAVMKYHGEHEGMMSFPDKGFSLALDFANISQVHTLLSELDEFIFSIGGKVYLAKDVRLSQKNFERIYGKHLPEWRRILSDIDPGGKFISMMSKRLGFRK